MLSFKLVLEIITVLMAVNYCLLLIPFLSWENLYRRVRKSSDSFYAATLVKIITLFSAIEDIAYDITRYSVFISGMLFALMVNTLEASTISFQVLTGVALINFLLGLFYIVMELEDPQDEGFLDDLVFKMMVKSTYKVKMPKDIYRLFSLYHFKYLDDHEHSGHYFLIKTAHDFSNDILSVWEKEYYREDVYKFLLQPKTVSILAAISNVLTDPKQLDFMESKEGTESRQVYTACIKDLSKEMLESVITLEKDTANSEVALKTDVLNSELIAALTKAKDNKFYIV